MNRKKKVTLLFNFNINEGFDNELHFRLLYNMKRKKVSNNLLKQMKNILKNKSTILIIEDYTMIKRKINVSILQNSLFFSMLYLFYDANLLKLCTNIKLYFNAIKFMNDINILTYNESIERNCEILKKT